MVKSEYCYYGVIMNEVIAIVYTYTKRYCIQDKKTPNFQDIRPHTHETPSFLPRNVNKDATSINNFTNKNLANKRQQTL